MDSAALHSDPPEARYFARLYCADEERDIPLGALATQRPGHDEVLWIDLRGASDEIVGQVWTALGFPGDALRAWRAGSHAPGIGQDGDCFWAQVIAVGDERETQFRGNSLLIVAGRNVVVSLHDGGLAFIDRMMRDDQRGGIGVLSAESFSAALLDAHLSTYFDATAAFESEVERLEVLILDDKPRDCLPELRRLRRAASRLRRMLAPHRTVFSRLSRPDFRPSADSEAQKHFAALDTRFERAMDVIENARDLVMGSFELFSAKTNLETNQAMRVLTFATVVVGSLSVIAAWLGMNFKVRIFDVQDLGFVIAVLGSLLIAAGLVLIARKKNWL